MKYVHANSRKSNTVLHILKGETFGEQPQDLGVGEIAEIGDRAYTECRILIKRYVVLNEKPDMRECSLCFDEEAQEVAQRARDRALEPHYANVRNAVQRNKEALRDLFRKK